MLRSSVRKICSLMLLLAVAWTPALTHAISPGMRALSLFPLNAPIWYAAGRPIRATLLTVTEAAGLFGGSVLLASGFSCRPDFLFGNSACSALKISGGISLGLLWLPAYAHTAIAAPHLFNDESSRNNHKKSALQIVPNAMVTPSATGVGMSGQF